MTDIQNSAAMTKHSLTRRIGRALLMGFGVSLTLMMLCAAFLVSFASAKQWEVWSSNHYWELLAWRLLLYIALMVAWTKLKARLPEPVRLKNRGRLTRIEILIVLLFALIELSKVLLLHGGA
ncbi:hypothetical protein [Pseudomonas azotoformans]|uniref:Uncharacterized protein n=1 Tax=Pseudomonas azotoformans TaxID=47878 RepID=A0A127HQX9_PSEAZ|nr:hypothetical protein [Pseudomonas azotoformans]AMN76883.1 hypothetical protein AYR47_00410 [Pseudomonas azotoformans]